MRILALGGRAGERAGAGWNNPPLRHLVATLDRYPEPALEQTGRLSMSSILRITVLLAALIGVAATATACNTVKGIGRDIEGGAEAVEDALQ